MRQLKTAGVLAAVIAVVVGLAFWDDWQTKKEEQDKASKNALVSLKADLVAKIEYSSTGEAEESKEEGKPAEKPKTAVPVQLSLVKQDGKWRLTAPLDAPADDQVVSDLIKAVADYKFDKVVATGKANWEAYGLSKPKRTITLHTEGEGGGAVTVYVGINAPVGYTVYTATDKSEDVYMGSQYVGVSTNKTLHDFRNKKLMDLTASDITSFTYQREKDAAITVARKDGKFVVEKPEALDADQMAANNFLDDLSQLKVAEFVDKPAADKTKLFDSKKRFAEVTLTDSKGGTKTVFFAKDGDATYAAFDAAARIFKLTDDGRTKVTKVLNDFRNRQVFSFKSSDIQQVDIDGVIYKRVKEDWYTAEDAGKFDAEGKFSGKEEEKPKAKSHIRGLLADLEFAKAEEILTSIAPASKNLTGSPKHRLVLSFAEAGKEALTIDVWAAGEDSEKIYLKYSGNTNAYKLPRTVVSSIAEKTPPSSAQPGALTDFPQIDDQTSAKK